MKISIIFSTYNGEYTLNRLLDSLKVLTPPPCEWNVIAVDNNSSDSTSTILKSYQNDIPLTILRELKPGKNAALNLAIKNLDDLGEFVIFTDDDVVFAIDFLQEYCRLFTSNRKHHIFGGTIQPLWEQECPQAILNEIPITVAFALTNERHYKQGVIDPCSILGPNMAIQKSILENGVVFNEQVGPNSKNYVMGSETEFLNRLKGMGYTAYFEPKIKVKHIVRPWQLSNKWLKQRAFNAGRALINEQIRNEENINHINLFGIPRWSILKYLKLMIFSLIRQDKYKSLWEINFLRGYMHQYKR
jgi:glycosyltransferase involved in cell wall biosynthesis